MRLLILLTCVTLSFAASNTECDLTKLTIYGGDYTLSNGGQSGSQAHYSCPAGKYPHPATSRLCLPGGRWTHAAQKFVCRDVSCPGQLMFEAGEYFPRRGKYSIGDVLHFDCYPGFERFGPEKRVCQEDGKWSGSTTTCEDFKGWCPNPGIPSGAIKSGKYYDLNDTVHYRCQPGLQLIGSAERTCLENKRWSGAEPSCQASYVFDSPEEVALSFSHSIAEIIGRAKPLNQDIKDRKLKIKKGDPLNIFILIDSSKSVGQKNFDTAKEIAATLIEKISTYDIVPRYCVMSYASFVKINMYLNDQDSTDPEKVIHNIESFRFKDHEGRWGTNTAGALNQVHASLLLDMLRNMDSFLQTRSVIFLMTDGKFNMGGDPAREIRKMRELLQIKGQNDREDYLDVYVFGLGTEVDVAELNKVASKKEKERHLFLMSSIEEMKSAFDSIIDESEAYDMCGLSKDHSDNQREQFPWIATFTVTRPHGMESCKGSIISRNFILTAAHCFHLDDALHYVTVTLGDVKKTISRKVKNIHRHPNYNPSAKAGKKVLISFDFDFALLELEEKLEFSSTIRPICLPCTAGSSWALKLQSKAATCVDHKNRLLSGDLVRSMFVTEQNRRDNFVQMDVTIKQGKQRLGCLEDAKKIPEYKDVADIRDAVTDNFLCTGGIDHFVEPQTCKGDGGGPLIIQYQKRFIQVGVISWGTVNSCRGYVRDRVPNESRDFHADVFKANEWIKRVVKDDVVFL